MPFQPKTFQEALAKHKPMKRRPMRSRASNPKPRSRMKPSSKRLGPGKKTKAWSKERAGLKVKFEAAGITSCELRGSTEVKHECGNDNYLGFAHSKKRRHITGNEIFEVALLCLNAHEIIERLPEAEMTSVIRQIIAARNVRM
jgi:hypothetical protein